VARLQCHLLRHQCHLPIRRKVHLPSVVHTDGFTSYDGLVDMGCKKHLRFDHARGEFSSRFTRGNHINGVEGFWCNAKTRLARFRGIRPHAFLFHLKECEFRYNHRAKTCTMPSSRSAAEPAQLHMIHD